MKNEIVNDMRSPYENIVIGNFLYGLGFDVGRFSRANVPPVCINLLQQTPLDPTLGDVFLNLNGTVRLLEFKRRENRSSKELYKINALHRVLAEQPHLEAVSRCVHWYIVDEGAAEAKDAMIKVSSYLDFNSAQRTQSLAIFTTELAQRALQRSKSEPSLALVSAYLRCLGDMANAGTASGTCFVVHVDAGGALRYAALKDFRDLTMDYKMLIDRERQVSLHFDKERELIRDRPRSVNKNMSPTHERSR